MNYADEKGSPEEVKSITKASVRTVGVLAKTRTRPGAFRTPFKEEAICVRRSLLAAIKTEAELSRKVKESHVSNRPWRTTGL
jgi:hypothetical protein